MSFSLHLYLRSSASSKHFYTIETHIRILHFEYRHEMIKIIKFEMNLKQSITTMSYRLATCFSICSQVKDTKNI